MNGEIETSLKSDIDDLLSTMEVSNEEVKEEPAETFENEEVEAETSEKVEVAEVEKSVEQKEEVEEKSQVETKVEPHDETKVTLTKAQYDSLMEKINSLASERVVKTTEPVKAEPEKPIEYVTAEIFDSLMESPEKFNAFLNNFATTIKSKTEEGILRAIPDVVMSYANMHFDLRQQANVFMENNPELKPVMKLVGISSTEVSAEHPDWTPMQCFEEAGNRIRTQFGIQKLAQNNLKQTQTQRKPAFAGQKGVRSTEPELTELEKQIGDLIN